MGVSQFSGYNFFDQQTEDPPWKDIVIGFRHATDAELKAIQLPVRHGYYFTNMSAQASRYCNWLLRRCKEQGIQFHQRKVHSLTEFAGSCDVIFNCSGLGSAELVGDSGMVPVRGQIMKVSAPWIKHFTLVSTADTVAYIIPCTDFVVIGGTAEHGKWQTHIEAAVSCKILENCSKIMASVKNAPVLGEWSGLRPYRPAGVRLERELVQCSSSQPSLEVIHNYGHGGAGLTFHWGCARYAASLAYKALGLPNICHHDDDLLYKALSTPMTVRDSKL
jgi:glycine/D-amino acid oxidase-like deaminating enzyme